MNFEVNSIIALISRIQNQANQFVVSELKKFKITGLVPVHGDILLALFFHERITMQELAKLVGRKKSTITTLVEKLIRLGYAQKQKDDIDNRYFIISMTEKGESLKMPLIEISMNLIKGLYRDMPIDRRVQLVNGLTEINNNLKKMNNE
jgi:MarR family transcriptional regulator, organic hydroperoxide resistance regulator